LLHMNAAVVMHHYFARRHNDAIEFGRKALELDPTFFPTRLWMGLAYQASGRHTEAITELQHARALSSGSTFVTATLAGTLAASGKGDEASAVLAELEAVGQRRYVPHTVVAAAHVCRGAESEALSCLEKAYDDRCIWLPYALMVDPRFDAVRGEARFRGLVRRVSAGGEQ
jgi:predicted Zn-dependent protease